MKLLFKIALMLLGLTSLDVGRPDPGDSGQHVAEYKGIYVDNLQQIVGNNRLEDDFLHWAKDHSFNALTLYNMKAVLGDPALRKALPTFIRKARAQGIREITAVVSNAVVATGLVDSYNRNQPDHQSAFDNVNLELEWWNKACTFDQYKSYLEIIRNWGQQQRPAICNEEYIGWFKNPTVEDSLMAAALVETSDRILVHDYQENLTFSYLQPRLDWIGKAARAQGKVMPIIIIFNAKTEFMGSYFTQHPFSDAFRSVMDEFQQAQFPGKANVRLIGYQIYNQSAGRLCKPQAEKMR
jgi:hypothetical protein